MNIEHKKTALNDDASIYSRGRDKTSKENFKNLKGKQKLLYFLDYYSKPIIAVIIILIAAVSLLNETVFNRSNCLLSVACVNMVQIADSEGAAEDLETLLPVETKNDYAHVSYYSLDDPNMNMSFVTHMVTGSVDIVLCSEDYFLIGSEQGMFADLREILPEETYNRLADRMLEGCIVKTDVDGTVLSRGESTPYGIDISDSSKFHEFGGLGENPILCVAVQTQQLENALTAVDYFTN